MVVELDVQASGSRPSFRHLRGMVSWPFDFPRRAPTQTWMMLTFGLFVGIAVIVVGVYAFIVLRQQLRSEAFQRIRTETENILSDLDRLGPGDDLNAAVATISHLTGRRVTVWHDGVRASDYRYGHVMHREISQGLDARENALVDGIGYEEFVDPTSGRRTLYVGMLSPRSGIVVTVGEESPPTFGVLRRTQLTLVIGMCMALLLSLLGSWIASQKVSGPLRALTASAERINAGELREVISVHSRAAEIQDLAASLDAMAEHFRLDITQLQRLIRIQNEFLGDVSHEVRNPIFAIGGYLEALGSPGLTDEQRERYVQKGVVNLERLNNLFSDLVEIARLEYREDLIQREVFDLQALVEEVTETARLKAEEKALVLDTANSSFFVEADRNRVGQVLTNLIENAIAYTDRGSIRCRLSRRGDKVRVEVQDTGRGIGEEHVQRIFDRFYRVDTARSRKHGGTGLGLSIVRQILHAHGESIRVESRSGEGSLFWFELPYRATKTPRPAQKEVEVA